MKTTMTAVLALSMMIGAAFGAAKQDPMKSTTNTKSTTSVKKHKKAAKTTSVSVKPAAAATVASK